MSDNRNNVEIHLQPLSCQLIGPCFFRADNDKTQAAKEFPPQNEHNGYIGVKL